MGNTCIYSVENLADYSPQKVSRLFFLVAMKKDRSRFWNTYIQTVLALNICWLFRILDLIFPVSMQR